MAYHPRPENALTPDRLPAVGDWLITSYESGPYMVLSTIPCPDRYNASDPMNPRSVPPGTVEISLHLRKERGRDGFIINNVRLDAGHWRTYIGDELYLIPPPDTAPAYQMPFAFPVDGGS